MDKKRLLWVGDATCPSGFALATHETLNVLKDMFDITVLGINYLGDPYHLPYDIYAAGAGGDWMGVGRLIWMCELVHPDVIIIQQDAWNIPLYMAQLREKKADGSFRYPTHAAIPVIVSVAVDGKNFDGHDLEGVAFTIFWTQFALDEARVGKYEGEAAVIPLGIDLDVFHPIDKYEARLRRKLPTMLDDAFIVGNVNRNQPRKRLDLTIKYFTEWIQSAKIEDAWLYLHVAPTGDMGIKIQELAKYYGLNRLILLEPPAFQGLSESDLRDTYNCFDVNVTTTQGEGFGLTTIEAMACGVPVIAPDWSALGDWARDAVWLVKCTSTAIGPPYTNVIGGIPDQQLFTHALNTLYRYPEYRKQNSEAGLERVKQARFRWANIGRAFADVVNHVLVPESVAT